MPIRKDKAGIWQIDVSVAGRRIQRSTHTQDKKAAQHLHDKLRADLWRERKLGEAPSRLWDDAAVAWLDDAADRKLKDLEGQRDKLRWLHPHFAGLALEKIDHRTINAALDTKRAERRVRVFGNGTRVTLPKASNATLNRYAAAISAVLNYAVRKGWLAAAPRIEKRKEARMRIAYLTQDQARRLLLELPDHLKPMAAFALATGLRQANVTRLEWEQIDIARRVAWIHGDQAKGGRPISVPLSEAALAVLAGQEGQHETWVFPYRGSTLDNPAGRAWKQACARAGIPAAFRWHDLRHTWASWHVMAGTPLEVLQILGGWQSIQMVQRYAHLAPSHVAAYAGNVKISLDSMLEGSRSEPQLLEDIGVDDGTRTHDNRNQRAQFFASELSVKGKGPCFRTAL